MLLQQTGRNRVQLGQEERRHQVLFEGKYVQLAGYGLAQRCFHLTFLAESACLVWPTEGVSDSGRQFWSIYHCPLWQDDCLSTSLKERTAWVRNVRNPTNDRGQKGRVQKGLYEPVYRSFALSAPNAYSCRQTRIVQDSGRIFSAGAGPYLPFRHRVSKPPYYPFW